MSLPGLRRGGAEVACGIGRRVAALLLGRTLAGRPGDLPHWLGAAVYDRLESRRLLLTRSGTSAGRYLGPWTLGVLLAAVGTLCAQPVVHSEPRHGVQRAVTYHAVTGRPVSDADPALPGETLLVDVHGATEPVGVLVGGSEVPGRLRIAWSPPRARRSRSSRLRAVSAATVREPTRQQVVFAVPHEAGGSFVELTLMSDGVRGNTATIPVHPAQVDPSQLSAADVAGLIERAATAIDDPAMAIAVTDRAGRPLGVYRNPSASDDAIETALSLARTGAFFSHNQAPLSSRTVRTLSRENFPNDVPNQPAAALFGIENTNRGCHLSDSFEPGQSIPPATNLAGAGPGLGVATIPGGLPVFKNLPNGGGQQLVGGIGVAGIDPDAAEFAAVAATFGTQFFVALPLPTPGAVYVDGIRLPFVEQTTRPDGTRAASVPGGEYVVAPRAGAAAPDGFLIAPRESATLTAVEVEQIITAARERAERTRAVIRLPLGSRSRMAIAVGDIEGNILGLFRMPDATVFSIDVAATKARNAVYFSSEERLPDDLPGVPPGTAVTARTIGFGSQSFFPTGIDGSAPGPFRELFLFDLANPCTEGRQPAGPNQSGIVFFPGSSPLYSTG